MSKVEIGFHKKKYGKQQKNVFWTTDLLRRGHNFLGHTVQYIGFKNVFYKIWVYGYQKTQDFT
jgi:hypothetical protein